MIGRIFCVSLFVVALLPARLCAQAVKFNFDNKTILCDSLNMPANTSANQLLLMLPELLQRPGMTAYSNYEVKVEGMSVNDVKDIALVNLHIEDIEKIEVNTRQLSYSVVATASIRSAYTFTRVSRECRT